MTITERPTADRATGANDIPALVAIDLYRDIHKGIRAELFGVTGEAGRVDPADDLDLRSLATYVQSTVGLLVAHAEHEDRHVQPAIETHLPDLADRIAADHESLEDRMDRLVARAGTVVAEGAASRRAAAHQLYLELASFTASYLEHQDLEERVVMPALADAIGFDATLGIHQAIVGSIPPDEMAQSLAVMLPAMNIEDRVELLGGMREGAPPEVFDGVWGLAGSVLTPADHRSLSRRLGLG